MTTMHLIGHAMAGSWCGTTCINVARRPFPSEQDYNMGWSLSGALGVAPVGGGGGGGGASAPLPPLSSLGLLLISQHARRDVCIHN